MRNVKSKVRKKGRIDRSESFDEFLAKDGLLVEIEDVALKEIIAEMAAVTTPRVTSE